MNVTSFFGYVFIILKNLQLLLILCEQFLKRFLILG